MPFDCDLLTLLPTQGRRLRDSQRSFVCQQSNCGDVPDSGGAFDLVKI